jgi:hypothetical protein
MDDELRKFAVACSKPNEQAIPSFRRRRARSISRMRKLREASKMISVADSVDRSDYLGSVISSELPFDDVTRSTDSALDCKLI